MRVLLMVLSAVGLSACFPDRVSTNTGTCSATGPLWEVSEFGLPRTNRWRDCYLSTTTEGDTLTGHLGLRGATLDTVEAYAGWLSIHFETPFAPPVRIPVLGPEEAYGEGHGAWITLRDEEHAMVGYVPRGHITLEHYELEEGTSEGSRDITPDRNQVVIDFTGLTYVHRSRGPTTLNGQVTFDGVSSGCFPDLGIHLPESLGTYSPDAVNSCELPLPRGTDGVAVPRDFYDGGLACGACVHIFALAGSVHQPIIDVCEDCESDEIRVHPDTIAALTRPGESGPVNLIWDFGTCPNLSGIPLRYVFRADSTPDRFAIQMRDIRHPVQTVEVEDSTGEYQTLRREGSWHIGEGLGPGPYNTRVTSLFNHVIEDLSIPLVPGGSHTGLAQFRACFSDEG